MARIASLPHAHADLHRQLSRDLSAPRPFADVEPGGRGVVLRGAARAGLPAAAAKRRLATRRHADEVGDAGRRHTRVAHRRRTPIYFRTRQACGCLRTSPVSQAAWRWRFSVFSARAGTPCATLPLAAALFLAVATPIGGVIVGTDPIWVPATKALAYATIATLVVGTVVLGSRNRYTRILSSRPVVWLGEISYEIFLLHVVVMAVTMNLVLHWPLFTGSLIGLYSTTLALTIPLAWLLHRYTMPSRRLRPARAAQAPITPAPDCDATPRPSLPESTRLPCASSRRE